MQKTVITTSRIAPPAGPFSPAIRAGDSVYVSGQVAQDPATGKLIDGDVTRQTEQIFENIVAVLQEAGLTLRDVVRVGVFLADMRDFQPMNAVYARWFEAPYPARTTVGVASLPLGALVEIEILARTS